jgi:phenylacetate-coenzyme A ligase PaaK-like adenylate-forming protein
MMNFELLLKLQGFPVEEAKRELHDYYSLSFSDRNKWIEDKKWQIASHHLLNNRLYMSLVGGDLPRNWSELPVIRKSNLQGDISQMLSNLFRKRQVYVSSTSGSSGHPFYFAKDKLSHAITWIFSQDRYGGLGITDQSVQARFYGIPLDTCSYYKEKVKDYFMSRIRFPVFDMSDAMVEKFVGQFKRKDIEYIYGYTNSILLFSKYLMKKAITLSSICPSLRLCIVTSEVCTEEDKETIETALGVPVIREYGASELGIIAIEDKKGRWEINEGSLLVEVLSDDNKPLPYGNEGKLVITSLHNRAMPFIRYDIGDLGVIDRDEKGLVLRNLSGRVNDTIILPSGKKSPGLTFYYVSRSLLETSGLLKEFIIRQTALDSFEFDVISDRPLTQSEVENIKRKMAQYLEPGLNLTINRVDRINRPASGKTKHFYSEIYS